MASGESTAFHDYPTQRVITQQDLLMAEQASRLRMYQPLLPYLGSTNPDYYNATNTNPYSRHYRPFDSLRAKPFLPVHIHYLSYSSPGRTRHAPVREPPAWRLNYKIGTGACGSVFLENVHIIGMKSPELWAVKRIPRDLANFTFKRYEAEINNL